MFLFQTILTFLHIRSIFARGECSIQPNRLIRITLQLGYTTTHKQGINWESGSTLQTINSEEVWRQCQSSQRKHKAQGSPTTGAITICLKPFLVDIFQQISVKQYPRNHLKQYTAILICQPDDLLNSVKHDIFMDFRFSSFCYI